MDLQKLLPEVIAIAREAGDLIAEIYQSGTFEQHEKLDETPVTSADIASHRLIVAKLQELTPTIPVLSEEDTSVAFAERESWPLYWLIDPLDGTQEFIAHSDDFATMIALVQDHHPIMGVVYAPISQVVYYAAKDSGAWKMTEKGEVLPIQTQRHAHSPKCLSVAVSRRQNIETLKACFTNDHEYHLVPLGSASLKSCWVAEGKVDCYLRLGPTGEWDTAATQCIVEEAGGTILDTKLQPLSYNCRESLENPNFITLGDRSLSWDIILTDQALGALKSS